LDYPKLDFVSVVMSSHLLYDVIPAFGHPNPDWDVPICLCHCDLSVFDHANLVWDIWFQIRISESRLEFPNLSVSLWFIWIWSSQSGFRYPNPDRDIPLEAVQYSMPKLLLSALHITP